MISATKQTMHGKLPPQAKSSLRRRLIQNRYIYLMILPVVAYFLIFKYWPMTWLSISFFDYKLFKGFAGSNFVGLKNFIDFCTGINFWPVIGNTLLLNLYALLIVFPAPVCFALMLNELAGSRFKRTVQTISYMPYFISTVVLASMIVSALSPSVGMVGNILKAFGIKPIYFLGDPAYFRSINVVSGVWQNTGWNAIIYLSALTGIDQQLYEAATADGAGRFRKIWHITLPGIRDTIIILLILQIGNLLNSNFEKVYLLQNDLNLSVSEVLVTYVYKMGMVRSNYSFATAVGLFNSVVSLMLVLMANALSRKYSEVSLF